MSAVQIHPYPHGTSQTPVRAIARENESKTSLDTLMAVSFLLNCGKYFLVSEVTGTHTIRSHVIIQER
jgi:hypothetical protein